MGTAQNRKVYGRHGVVGAQYGVSFTNLAKLRKRIKTDQALAEQLWATKNHDARVLATMIADPEAIRAGTLDRWVRDLDSYPVVDAFSALAARTPFAAVRRDRWRRSRMEFVAAAGWNMVAIAAGANGISDAYFVDRINEIEADIRRAKNRVRHAMNHSLIAIGVRSTRLERLALAAAKRIGPVAVDHGATSCKTPDATASIKKTKARRK